jgi:hypothetical protein
VHAPLVRGDERTVNDRRGVVVQPEVVERELERLARPVEKRSDPARDVERRLPAVRERVNLDQGCCLARSDALYARFFAW